MRLNTSDFSYKEIERWCHKIQRSTTIRIKVDTKRVVKIRLFSPQTEIYLWNIFKGSDFDYVAVKTRWKTKKSQTLVFQPPFNYLCIKVIYTCMLNRVQLFNSMDCIPPGPSVHGILQTRILEWVAMPFSRGLPKTGIELASPVSNALKVGSLFTEPLEKPMHRNHHLLMSMIRNQKLKNIYLVTSNEQSPFLSQSMAFKSTYQSWAVALSPNI